MRKLVTLLSLIACFGYSTAQPPNQIELPGMPLDSALDSEIRVNMAIPSSPAYQILGGEPSNLLRVSNPREFSVAASDFVSNGSLVIPQNFGVDFSPFMVLENGGLLKDSTKGTKFRPLRISFGSESQPNDSTGNMQLAQNVGIGLQYTFTKPGTSFQGYKDVLRKALQPLTNDYETRTDSLRKEYYQKMGVNITQFMATAPDSAVTKLLDARNAWADSVYNTLPSRISKESFGVTVANVKKKFKRDTWNDFRVDVATAILLNSPDTLLTVSTDSLRGPDTTVTLQEVGFWGTVSFPLLGTNWLQGMAGGNYTMTRSTTADEFKSVYSLSARLYLGSNRLKGFIEGQYKGNQVTDLNSYLVTIGTELNVIDGIWLNFYAGLSQDVGAERNRIVTQFNLHFSLPERFSSN